MANTGIFDNDTILPGVITNIIPDYAKEYDTSKFNTTESVTIIGTAFNGPVGTAVPIFSPEHAKYIFGDSFDAKTRREASLVAEIFDAWDRGCRTIYAVRVSGKAIYKDFNLATESKLKLRLNGIFPSNENKDVFINYSADQSENGDPGVIRLYKPITRSNMRERMQGLAISDAELLVGDIKLLGYGFNKDSRLVDVLNIVNNHESNNIIRLSIVNEFGADVTASSEEAKSLCLGTMFPGVYTIGRDKAAEGVTIKTDVNYILSNERKPHANYQEAVWKELIVNSDVSSAYPIFAKASNDLSALLPIATDIDGEWLKSAGVIDKIALKNKKDYEEVDITPFDLYQRLGSGFAQTAQILEVKGNDGQVKGYKVTTPKSTDPNKVIGIFDGIYSMLENHSTNYTVLSGMVNAETKINGKLPRREAFKKRKAGIINLQENSANVLEVIAKIDEKDFSAARQCKIEVNSVADGLVQADVLANLDTSIKAIRIATLTEAEATNVSLSDGVLVAVVGAESTVLKRVENGQLVAATDNGVYVVEVAGALKAMESTNGTLADKVIPEGKYFIASCTNIANVYKSGTSAIEPIAALSEIANKEIDEDYTLCFVEDLPNALNVKVFSTEAQWMTYRELSDRLGESEVFASYFKSSALTPDIEVGTQVSGTGVDKGIEFYDTTMYIPYTTSDNFARHLAQHCTYTSLKTFPTHGIIGCAKLNGVNLSTVADRVNEISKLDLDLYAKTPNGNNMLTNNNLPFPIGMRLSVPFIQYSVTTGNGYNYVANGAAGYAGMVSTLPADRSSTNQPISLPGLAFELSNYQLSKLTGKGIVTVKKTTQGTVITDGITMAPVDSVYRRLSTAKVINIVDERLRNVILPFIGLQDNMANRNSMNTAITSELNKLKETLINYYKFAIVTDPNAANLGQVEIKYVVIPFNEISKVNNSISVTENQ